VCSYSQSQDGLTSATAMRRASNTISTLFAHALSGNRLGLRRGLGANDADPRGQVLVLNSFGMEASEPGRPGPNSIGPERDSSTDQFDMLANMPGS